jgi:hypothetical protein
MHVLRNQLENAIAKRGLPAVYDEIAIHYLTVLQQMTTNDRIQWSVPKPNYLPPPYHLVQMVQNSRNMPANYGDHNVYYFDKKLRLWKLRQLLAN